MELLFDLISRNKIDIRDISIVEITNQYMEYVDHVKSIDMDLASDFIMMATRLLEIKSRYILYVKDKGESEQDPRQELIDQIEEYKKYRQIAEEIKDKIKDADVKTAILTVPSVKSQEVANLLVDAGVKGILSFSPVHLHLPKDVVVQYVDLTSELQTLLYFMRKED